MNVINIYGNLKAPIKRIISLAPSLTEQLFYLGMGASVAGVTRQCNYPEEVKNVEIIGSFLKPDIKLILELNPDAVIGLSNMHKHIPELLKSNNTGIILLEYSSVQDVLDGMDGLASLSLEPDTASKRVSSLRERIENIKTEAEGKSGIRTLFLISESPMFTPGLNSYQYDALRIAGVKQISGSHSEYERVTLEEVVYFDPEIIFACGIHRGQPLPKKCPDCAAAQPVCQRSVEDFITKPGWENTTAAKNGNIIPVPCHWLCRPGNRLIDGIESIAQILEEYRKGKTGNIQTD